MPSNLDWDSVSFEDVEMDFGANFQSEEQVTEPEFPKEGQYHFVISGIDAANENAPGTAFFTFEILKGNVDEQEGKQIRFPIWAPRDDAKSKEAAIKRWQKSILQIMLVFGMRKAGEIPKMRVNQEFWNSMEGKQCIGRVSHRDKTRKTDSGKQFTFTEAVFTSLSDLFPMFHPDVSEVPIDEAAAEMAGYKKEDEESI